MRRALLLAMTALWSAGADAAVLNVEFQFTPFRGDPAKDEQVETVSGTARVFLNGVLQAEQEVQAQQVPVMFDEREVAPSVWIPMASLGPAVRKGRNTLRIEFVPTDAKADYRAHLRWATVTDEVREQEEPGRYQGTNMADKGVEDRKASGRVVMEREFTADFAKKQPWHDLPAVTAVTDEDRTRLTTLLRERADRFAPDFAGVYRLLEGRENIVVADVRKLRCLDAAYEAGVRMTPPSTDALDVATTGSAEVVLRRKDGTPLYALDRTAFERIEGDEMQMCAGVALSVAYPQRLVVYRGTDGAWQVAY